MLWTRRRHVPGSGGLGDGVVCIPTTGALVLTGYAPTVTVAAPTTIALVAHTTKQPGANGGATDAIDTTGATIVILVVSGYGPTASQTPTDSKSNTWTALTRKVQGNAGCQIYYAVNPTVGSGHTFTYAATDVYATIQVLAYSGVATSTPFDVENGATGAAVSTLATGSVTPAADNSLIVAGLCLDTTVTNMAINASFTLQDGQAWSGGGAEAGYDADQIQTTATARNPAWSWTTASVGAAAVIAVFKHS